jgi:hypothetical protein
MLVLWILMWLICSGCQHHAGVILMASIVYILWRQFQITIESRIYLLRRLKQYVEATTLSGTDKNEVRWHAHFHEWREFAKMLKTMEARLIKELGRPHNEKAHDQWWDAFFEKHVSQALERHMLLCYDTDQNLLYGNY